MSLFHNDADSLRPLFLMRHGQRLYFASEIKAFLDLARFRRDIDLEGFHHYFSLGYLPRRHTPFRQIEELPGGRLVEVDLGRGAVRESSYYKIRYTPQPVRDERELAKELQARMQDLQIWASTPVENQGKGIERIGI